MVELEITVLKYESDYSKRNKDIKKNHWFSFPNDLLLHPDFLDIDGEELKSFIWVLSVCSKIGSHKVRINIQHAVRVVGIKQKSLLSMIEKLQSKQIDVAHGLTTASPRPLHNITEHNTTLHNITKHNNSSTEPKNSVAVVEKIKSPPVVFKISNSLQIPLKKDLIDSWAETYPEEFLREQMMQARSWILSNPQKAPKSAWSRFFNSWFARGWERYRTQIKSNPSKMTTQDLMQFMGWTDES